ncbi:hypothetical protein [Halomonas sp. QHL1]|uniref:hypothetical protein n=1 Tax=Halomonas sp. QHL1 TaxID=1123773 RepID=UPI0008FD3B38|nr:hypothetical protein [Halomonas sp. QHL1]
MSNLLARIHQGQYDSGRQLLNLRKNAINRGSSEVVDAVNMRLKKVNPKIYQRLVGPLSDRVRDKRFKCYCNHPKSLYGIYLEIMEGGVDKDALICDACWEEDLAKTWGYYGWASKKIPVSVWERLCDRRADLKFVG